MKSVREQYYDWKHSISKENTTSRGFYIFVTFALVVILLASLGLEVAAIAGALSGTFRIVGFLAPVIAVALIVGTVFALSRND